MKPSEVEKAEQAIQNLKEATRQANETLKEFKNQRQLLKEMMAKVEEEINGKIVEAVNVALKDTSDGIREFQKDVEDRLGKRFDLLIGGPLSDVEKFLRNLHEVYSTIPMSEIAPMPGNPLFPKRSPRHS